MMKGIKCCGECAYYNMKKHKCTGGAKDPGNAEDSFYADCPHVEAEPVRHGRWIENRTDLICSACRWEYSDELRFMSHHGLDAVEEAFAYCPHCGARMDATDTNVGGKRGADNG